MEIIRRWLDRMSPVSFHDLHPDEPFFAIGDVHGRQDLLNCAFLQLPENARVILVGDYIDRGEDSAGVLSFLKERMEAQPGRITCLMGNHERMLLDFIEDPKVNSRRWLRNGGLQTLASLGLPVVSETASDTELLDLSQKLETALGPLLPWLSALPLHWRSGNVAVVHAAADPRRAIEHQQDDHLLWGHRDFRKRPRKDGLWVIHGHTIVAQPTISQKKISIDTGAYSTGKLTIAHVSTGQIEFSTV